MGSTKTDRITKTNRITKTDSTTKTDSIKKSCDVLIVGGGVIGLSLAWELSQHGAKVCVVDRGQLGMEASWAGAGMIPPGPAESHWAGATPFEQLAGLSQRLQRQWHERLLELTGIDNEYCLDGAIHLAFTDDEAQALDEKAVRWQQLGITYQAIDAATLADLEPALASQATQLVRAYLLPEEAQLRNPRHLHALIAACQLAGVDLRPSVAVHKFEVSKNRLTQALTDEGPIRAEQFCLAAGSWSGQLAASLGLDLSVRPIRGQIVLLHGPPGLVRRIINVCPRYFVPRHDGRLLVGSTQDDVGFLKENTAAGVGELMQFAQTIAPDIAQLPIETCWSGLRPATADGLPYLGRLPQYENGWLATGHFRAGLQLSPATAVVMRALMLGQKLPVDVTGLGVDR